MRNRGRSDAAILLDCFKTRWAIHPHLIVQRWCKPGYKLTSREMRKNVLGVESRRTIHRGTEVLIIWNSSRCRGLASKDDNNEQRRRLGEGSMSERTPKNMCTIGDKEKRAEYRCRPPRMRTSKWMSVCLPLLFTICERWWRAIWQFNDVLSAFTWKRHLSWIALLKSALGSYKFTNAKTIVLPDSSRHQYELNGTNLILKLTPGLAK